MKEKQQEFLRVRLKPMFVELVKKDTGCYYIALIGAWFTLNPGKIINRDLTDYVLKNTRKGDQGVDKRDFVEKFERCQSIFGLRLNQIQVDRNIMQSDEEIKRVCNFPPGIKMVRNKDNIFRAGRGEAGIIYYENNIMGHYGNLSAVPEFKDVLGTGLGGQEDYIYWKKKGLSPRLCFILTKGNSYTDKQGAFANIKNLFQFK